MRYDINYGIKTGYNEAFIIDNDTKEALVAEDPRSAEILKPVLRGRDIKRYHAEWEERWLIATFPAMALNIDDYPAVKKYLLSFGKARLEQSGSILTDGRKSRKKTGHAWHELQDTCAYHEVFDREKLIWIELVGNGRFAYDNSRIYCEATTFIMTGKHLKYLCIILNTNIISWFLQRIAPTSGMGTLRWKKIYVETIPIPKLDMLGESSFIDLMERILKAKAVNPNADISAIETEINLRVCKLYRLTSMEISTIKKYYLS